MKCQYESEILFKLMERDGLNIPSSVPPYEAEIKAYLINQVKQAYPKLTDYEAEWLLYNYTKHLPAEFPISSATNATSATFENVVPFAYQNAVLKGQTLVNLNTNTNVSQNLKVGGKRLYNLKIPYTIVANKPFTLKLNVKDSTVTQQVMMQSKHIDDTITYTVIKEGNSTGYVNMLITKTKDVKEIEIYVQTNETGNATIENVVLLEGDYTNVDIPYFEGMQSVQMPVLTTTGKNLFDGKWIKGKMITEDGSIISDNSSQYSESFIRVSKGNYISSNNGTNRNVNIFKYDFDGNFIGRLGGVGSTFTVDGDCLIRFSVGVNNTGYFQFEQGTVATIYEPFKSNILTVNEDVTLRGIGDVQDELDLMTGEVTQCITEIVLSGSEKWVLNRSTINHNLWQTTIANPAINSTVRKNNMLCNKLIVEDFASLDNKDYEFITINNGNSNVIYLKLDKTKASSVTELKNYLQSNPLTLQYQLATESIKTVDLTTVNEKGETDYFVPLEGTMNVQSSGEIIQPTFDMSVPVEATTQNLASFINLEME